MLNIIKRCKTPEDGVRMAAYYEDILNENLDIYETFKKNGIKMVANGF